MRNSSIFYLGFPLLKEAKARLSGYDPNYLPNYSRCLGSFSLLYKPGDLAFVSTTELDSYLARRRTIAMQEFHRLKVESNAPRLNRFDAFGSDHFSQHAFDFSDSYLKLRIGEPVSAAVGNRNYEALTFLHGLLRDMRNRSREATELVDHFFEYPYADEAPGWSARG